MSAPIPERRPRPKRSMKDMGMNMAAMDMSGMDMDNSKMNGMNPKKGHKKHRDIDTKKEMGSMYDTKSEQVEHGPDRHGPGAAAVAQYQYDRLDEPVIGLG